MSTSRSVCLCVARGLRLLLPDVSMTNYDMPTSSPVSFPISGKQMSEMIKQEHARRQINLSKRTNVCNFNRSRKNFLRDPPPHGTPSTPLSTPGSIAGAAVLHIPVSNANGIMMMMSLQSSSKRGSIYIIVLGAYSYPTSILPSIPLTLPMCLGRNKRRDIARSLKHDRQRKGNIVEIICLH